MPGRFDLTEQYPCPFPLVYGYIRLTRDNAIRLRALESVVTTYCDQHELRLGGVFAERPEVVSSEFASLLNAVSAPGVYGVVIPSGLHLGRGSLAAVRRDRVLTAGARLLVIRNHHRDT